MPLLTHAAPPKPNPLEGSVIQSIILVDQVTRSEVTRFESASLPGHLLQLVVSGEIEQEVSGQKQRVGAGSAIWYHENEAVRGRILKTPWTFYTVNFLASRLPPPPHDERVWQISPAAFDLFDGLLRAWRSVELPPNARHLRVFAIMMELLLEVLHPATLERRSDLPAHTWWDIESKLREDLSLPVDLKLLEEMSGRSQRSIIRACELATGRSPMKRLKELRMSYARGLVLYSQMSMTEIALRVGYGRVQEFSRDYGLRFGVTPRKDRQGGPDYRVQQVPDD